MHRRKRIHHVGAAVVVGLTALTIFGGTAAGSPQRRELTTITLDTLPIANGLPLTLGINKGFFAAQGLEIKSTTLQSGNDIVLAMSNNQANIGYVGYVPAMIARTSGIPITIIAASDDEGTSTTDNWQDILVKGSSSIQTPAQLAGKTIAVNALRVTATAVATEYYGISAAQGLVHDTLGVMLFIASAILLVGCARLMASMPPRFALRPLP